MVMPLLSEQFAMRDGRFWFHLATLKYKLVKRTILQALISTITTAEVLTNAQFHQLGKRRKLQKAWSFL